MSLFDLSRFYLLFTVVRSYGCNFCIFLAKADNLKLFFWQNGVTTPFANVGKPSVDTSFPICLLLVFRVQFPVACEYSISSSSLGSLSLSSVTNNKGKPKS
jgi:hypothetical protein